VRKILTQKEWKRHLEAQLASGKTVKAYCNDKELDLSSFYRQRRKRSEIDAGAESQAFVMARVLQPPKVSGSSLSIRVKEFTLTLEPGYGSDDLEGVLITLVKVRHVLCGE